MASRLAWAASSTYEGDDLRQHLTRLAVDDDLGELVERGGLRVDDDHRRARPQRDQRNVSGGVDDQRRAHHEHHVRLARQPDCLLHSRHRHRFSEQHHGRLEKASAACPAARWHLKLEPGLDLASRLPVSAVEALHRSTRSMDLDYPAASRLLVQPVGVLRHDSGHVAGSFEGGERLVPRVRAGGQRDPAAVFRHLPVGARVRHEVLDRGDLDRVVLLPQAPLSPEGRDAALRRDARAGQRQAATSGREQLSRALDRQASTECCLCVEYASRATAVGKSTQGDALSWRIAVTLKSRNVSADLPFSCRPGISSTAMKSEHAWKVVQPMRRLNGGAAPQNLAAVFTVSPSAVYWSRSVIPMFPTTAAPVFTPVPQLIGGRFFCARLASRSGAWLTRSYAQRMGGSAGAGCATGAFHRATISSPTYLSIVPDHLRMSVLISSRYSWMTACTSSAAIASDMAVKPRMSTNSSVMSLRSPREMISSTEREAASCCAMRGST